MDRKMKAYRVFPGSSPHELGCALIFAASRNQARLLGYRTCPISGQEYLDFNARREPEFDRWAGTEPSVIETNSELPEGAPAFFDDNI